MKDQASSLPGSSRSVLCLIAVCMQETQGALRFVLWGQPVLSKDPSHQSFFFPGTHCLEPVAPPENLQIANWDGQPIEFGSDVLYECENGMKFSQDLEQDLQNATCKPGNQWTEPIWMTCVESKIKKTR